MSENLHNFLEQHHVVPCFPKSVISSNADIFNGNPQSLWIDMTNWQRATFIVQKGTGATGTARAVLQSADDDSGTNPTNLACKYRKATSGDSFSSWADAVASGTVITAGEDQVWEFSLSAQELEDDQPFVGFSLAEIVDSEVNGGVTCILTNPAIAQSIPASVLS